MKIRMLAALALAMLGPGLIHAQTSSPPPNASSNSTASEDQDVRQLLRSMQDSLTETQNKMADQQRQIELLTKQLATVQSANGTVSAGTPGLMDAAMHSSAPEISTPAPTPILAGGDERKESPLSFRIGGAEFTPGGFMDFTSIFRTTNTGNLGTNFFAIPFSNSVSGHLTESRFTAQNSRLTLKVHDKFGENDVTGYVEMDFLGNDAANAFVTSNSHTFRQRLYWADVRRGNWEILAGQAWSWLTPNRVGMSSYTPEVFYTQNMDFNYQVGLTWTRAPQVRVVYHPNEHWGMGIALENPEQFTGQSGEVTFPQFFNAQLSTQFDAANNSSTPNLHPDIIPKVAWDTTTAGGKHMHVEAAGLLTTIKITNIPAVPNATFVSHTKTGAGIEGAVNLELLKNIRFVSNGFYSYGGGRYVFGMGPDAVARAVDTAGGSCTAGPPVTNCDLQLSLVHSISGIIGFEAQITPKTMLYGYYGGAYFQRNFSVDLTNPNPGQLVGFGAPRLGTFNGSSSSNNRAIQEPTFGWTQTFWKDPQYGALQLITQASYLTRSPWFVAAGAPKNAHLTMAWVDIRYVLP